MVYNLAKKDTRVVFVGSDLGHSTLADFKAQMPERFFMEGVSEQHLIGFLAGLALSGKIPYFNTIAVFAYRRCLEQLITDIALPNLPVRIIGSGGGLVYTPLGPTHVATDDIAILRTIPNMTIVACADATEMSRFMPQTLNYPGPIYIRLAKGGDPVATPADQRFGIGRAYVIKNGCDIVFFSTGITLSLATDAAALLSKEGIDAAIVHVPTVKPLDTPTILAMIDQVRAVVSIEEGTIIGGLGSAVAELLAESGFDKPKAFKRLGLPDQFTDKYGSQVQQMDHFGLNVANITQTARRLFHASNRRQSYRRH